MAKGRRRRGGMAKGRSSSLSTRNRSVYVAGGLVVLHCINLHAKQTVQISVCVHLAAGSSA